MIHTVYSNSYEVLRVCLMNNIEALGVSTVGRRQSFRARLRESARHHAQQRG